MPLGNNPRFSEVRSFFSGPANLSAYVRGGSYVPNIAANNAISTTVAGLRLSQFSGAELTEPAVALVAGNPSYDLIIDANNSGSVGAWGGADLVATGWLRVGTVHTAQSNYERWATTSTTSYSAKATIISGSASDFSSNFSGNWTPITSGSSGPSVSTNEYFGQAPKTVGVRFDIALTSNTSQILKTITVYFTLRYLTDGGGVIS